MTYLYLHRENRN